MYPYIRTCIYVYLALLVYTFGLGFLFSLDTPCTFIRRVFSVCYLFSVCVYVSVVCYMWSCVVCVFLIEARDQGLVSLDAVHQGANSPENVMTGWGLFFRLAGAMDLCKASTECNCQVTCESVSPQQRKQEIRPRGHGFSFYTVFLRHQLGPDYHFGAHR